MTAHSRARIPEVSVKSADDIVDVLLNQHQQLRTLCMRVLAASGGERKRLFEELTTALQRHERGEQEVVHPITRDRTQRGGDAVGTACAADEERAGQAISALAALGVDHATFPAKFTAFHESLLEHTAYEERNEFPRLRRYVPTQRLHTMANDIRNVQAMP
jgi:hypothetical protein